MKNGGCLKTQRTLFFEMRASFTPMKDPQNELKNFQGSLFLLEKRENKLFSLGSSLLQYISSAQVSAAEVVEKNLHIFAPTCAFDFGGRSKVSFFKSEHRLNSTGRRGKTTTQSRKGKMMGKTKKKRPTSELRIPKKERGRHRQGTR